MSNLLPSDVQKKVWRQTRDRAIVVYALVLAGALAAACAALVPSIVVVSSARAHVRERFGAEGVPAAPPDATTTAPLTQAQAIIAQLAAFPATTSPSVLRAALAFAPRGITIDHITYTIGAPSSIVLSGRAQSPEALSAYRSALASDSRFSSVSVPLDALLGAKDGSFTLTLSGNF